jgi:hypothetical protein
MKFAGFIEGSDFGEGFIMVYKKMLAYFADALLSGEDFKMLDYISGKTKDYVDAKTVE